MAPSKEQADQNPSLVLLQGALEIAQGHHPAPVPEQTAQLSQLAPQLLQLPPSEVQQLLGQILLEPQADAALQWLQEVGALAQLLPELEATVNFTQEMGRRHKDVWKHTKQVVVQAEPRPAIRWAALLHDIGKVTTRAVTPEGKVTFHGHAEVGARMFDRISRALQMARPLRKKVRFLILHHLRASQYAGQWSDSAVRRFAREMDEHLEDLLLLSRADITSARPHRRQQALSHIQQLEQRIAQIREQDSRRPPLPSGLGHAIMERFSLKPGPLIGQVRQALEREIELGELEPFLESDYYLAYLDDHPDLLGPAK